MTAGSGSVGQGRHIPSLDGLRAISITAVLLGHLTGTTGFPAAATAIFNNSRFDLAWLGVLVFFVISGYLITRLLMEERERYGAISLRRFYLRRVMRIFPAYYVFVLALVVMGAAGFIVLTISDVAHALTYTMNYTADRSWSVGHLWSLAVEEQFYLLWPLTLVLVGVARGHRIAIAVIAVVPLVRFFEGAVLESPVVGNSFETTADAIAVGCLFALTEGELMARSWFRRLVGSGWLIALGLLAGLAISTYSRPGWLIGWTVTELSIGLAILHLIRQPTTGLGWVLNLRPVVFIGVMSYSIYLWQQVFLNRTSDAFFTSFPVNISLVFVAAAASFFLIERPVLRLRPLVEGRLLARRSTQPTDRP